MERGIALLSGGIDSPVAIHLLQDRLDIIATHFHQKPLTDEKEIEKVKELIRVLNVKKLYLIPFTPVLNSDVSLRGDDCRKRKSNISHYRRKPCSSIQPDIKQSHINYKKRSYGNSASFINAG